MTARSACRRASVRTGIAVREPRSTQRAPTVSVRPWARIEARIANDAISNTTLRSGAWDSSTNNANSIDATPLGPNQAMNAFSGRRSGLRANASAIATGRATNSRTRMKRSTARALPGSGVVTTSAPNSAKAEICRIALRFSLKRVNARGSSASVTPSAIPATKVETSPLPIVTSASANAINATASA